MNNIAAATAVFALAAGTLAGCGSQGATDRKKWGGTGLGLAIVKHGAIYHHAKVSLESTEGVGTTVTICFPDAVQPVL